jgi:hypothetical protein
MSPWVVGVNLINFHWCVVSLYLACWALQTLYHYLLVGSFCNAAHIHQWCWIQDCVESSHVAHECTGSLRLSVLIKVWSQSLLLSSCMTRKQVMCTSITQFCRVRKRKFCCIDTVTKDGMQSMTKMWILWTCTSYSSFSQVVQVDRILVTIPSHPSVV